MIMVASFHTRSKEKLILFKMDRFAYEVFFFSSPFSDSYTFLHLLLLFTQPQRNLQRCIHYSHLLVDTQQKIQLKLIYMIRGCLIKMSHEISYQVAFHLATALLPLIVSLKDFFFKLFIMENLCIQKKQREQYNELTCLFPNFNSDQILAHLISCISLNFSDPHSIILKKIPNIKLFYS